LAPTDLASGIQVAGVLAIDLMKLDAIAGRGTRKDFGSHLEGLTDGLKGVGQGNSAQDEAGRHGQQETDGHFCDEAIP